MIKFISQPWPWYVSGPLIGLMVPLLLLSGNKTFGVSASLRHVCAICVPAKIPFFRYNWKKEAWNLFFVSGILAGGFIASIFLSNGNTIQINPKLAAELSGDGITDYHSLRKRALPDFIKVTFYECGCSLNYIGFKLPWTLKRLKENWRIKSLE